MSYIFRLHNEGIDTLNDWGGSFKYSSNVIEQIHDPNGESSTREITSIPSPFARIDLVKTAFKKVVEMSKKSTRSITLEGKTIHHKMVSDCLDVGQLFFEFDKHSDKLRIVVWDKDKELNTLLHSPNPAHRQLGETYRIFLAQDGAEYNFQLMDRMYLLNYLNGPKEMNIIGATSPATLFFTSANDLSYITPNIQFNNCRPFDNNFCPLHQRDVDYIKYLWALKANIKNFPSLFKEVNTYMDVAFQLMDQNTKSELRNITNTDLNNYADISVDNNAGHTVVVLRGINLKQQKNEPSNIELQSGFVIYSDYTDSNGHKPLVLPVDSYTYPTVYTKTNLWNIATKAPYKDNQSNISHRILPDEGSIYPYLTISDFLTDTIVRLPYEINRESFFDGNISNANGKGFLLPLTELFFHCFTIEQLCGVMNDGNKMFEMRSIAGGVTVILRIPIKNGMYIEYRRTYFEAITPNIPKNDGALIDKTFGLGIMPLVKFPEQVKKYYRIALFDLDSRTSGRRDVSLNFVNGRMKIHDSEYVHRKREEKVIDPPQSSIEAYAVHANFDYIHVQVANARCVLIPKFSNVRQEGSQYTFAVDFGATNTHIEYAINKGRANTFDIKSQEKQMHRLHKKLFDPDIEAAFDHNFVPEIITDDTQYTFPTRTVFAERKGLNYNTKPYSLVDGNITFLYEKDEFPKYNDAKTDLKWNKDPNKAQLFLENLYILMRNKLILGGGKLEATKIIWFYPASMGEGLNNKYNIIWKSLYIKYFLNEQQSNVAALSEENVISISESAAPFRYYRDKKGAKSEVVTIDIGGSTTDVFVVEKSLPKMLMSFRYASEAVFGDAYGWDAEVNGYVKKYSNQFSEVLSVNKLESLKKIMDEIIWQGHSPDIIAFLFSLASNQSTKDNESLNFLKLLAADDYFRYAFIIFYGSIFYFIAKTMKAKDLAKPLTLAFSGNGSKTIVALSSETTMIARFAKLIFDGVYGDNNGKIDLIIDDNPKKATCKGGIIDPVKQEYNKIDDIKHIFIGDNFDHYDAKKINYSDINQVIIDNVVEQVCVFMDFLFKLHEDNNDFFTDKLSADPRALKIIKEICSDKADLKGWLIDGLEKELNNSDENNSKISETLFFYPLIGVLHEIARKISDL